MRHFYIFNITSTMNVLGHFYPYELFRTLETIYYGNQSQVIKEETILKQLLNKIDIDSLDNQIYQKFKHNYFYTTYHHRHVIRDIFRKETSIMEIHNSYIKLETNILMPRFLETINKNHTFFVCDFENKDYYFLDETNIIFPKERHVNQI